MKFSRPTRDRPLLAGLALGFALGAVGCSGGSSQSGTQAPVQEADKQAALKSAEIRKKQMKTRAMSPRAKQGNRD